MVAIRMWSTMERTWQVMVMFLVFCVVASQEDLSSQGVSSNLVRNTKNRVNNTLTRFLQRNKIRVIRLGFPWGQVGRQVILTIDLYSHQKINNETLAMAIEMVGLTGMLLFMVILGVILILIQMLNWSLPVHCYLNDCISYHSNFH